MKDQRPCGMWKPFRPLEGHWGKEGLALFRGVSVGEKEISHLQVDRFLCNMKYKLSRMALLKD